MTIYFGKADDQIYDHKTLFNMFRFRHQIFHDRLKWDVNSIHGMEYDEFDVLNPYHMIASNESGEIEACWRILPTTGPYMLKDTFPELLRGVPAPEQDDIWELSRFAVAPNNTGGKSQAILNDLTTHMLQRAYEFGLEKNITRYVTVTSVAVERMIVQAGYPLRRLADGVSQKIGRVTTVACWLDINEQYRHAAYDHSLHTQAA
ncbi:MAG: acyl-homoserine-lactone synthase [Gammaproteobacteria bacterium]|nr:acyl-homoserine-lactone synthase [Gammaproteobacteria bacterium]MDH5778319.1 acyl-homoserine-lactone synthase [Gammaproteobacteria bacterium]